MPYRSRPASGGVPGRDNRPTWDVVRRIPHAGRRPAGSRTLFVGRARSRRGHLALRRRCGCLPDTRVRGHARPVAVVPFHESGGRIRLYHGRADGAGAARRPGHIKEEGCLAPHPAVHALRLAVDGAATVSPSVASAGHRKARRRGCAALRRRYQRTDARSTPTVPPR